MMAMVWAKNTARHYTGTPYSFRMDWFILVTLQWTSWTHREYYQIKTILLHASGTLNNSLTF